MTPVFNTELSFKKGKTWNNLNIMGKSNGPEFCTLEKNQSTYNHTVAL